MSIVRKIGEGYYALETEDQDVQPGDLERMTELFERASAITHDEPILVREKGKKARAFHRLVPIDH